MKSEVWNINFATGLAKLLSEKKMKREEEIEAKENGARTRACCCLFSAQVCLRLGVKGEWDVRSVQRGWGQSIQPLLQSSSFFLVLQESKPKNKSRVATTPRQKRFAPKPRTVIYHILLFHVVALATEESGETTTPPFCRPHTDPSLSARVSWK